MNATRLMVLLAAAPALAVGGARVQVTVHLDRPADAVSAMLEGGALPAPGTPGAGGLVPQLLRNPSFEMTPPTEPRPLPKAWGKAEGWDYLSCGSKRMLVRRRRRGRGRDVLLLAPRKRWGEYRLSLMARKIDGPGGFCVLFEVSSSRTHFRWTLGALGNRYHVLEKVHGGEAERLGSAVVGRIEAGRCYKIEVSRRGKVAKFSLDGRLIHSVNDRMPDGGIGLADGDATVEYFDLAVYGRRNAPRYLLDRPAEGRRSTVAAHWEPLSDPRNGVAYKWDLLHPANSYLSQKLTVRKYVGGDAGICQHGVSVAAGTAYRGRVFLRAGGKTTVVVSLRSKGGKVLARQDLGKPTDVWRAFDFTLKPSASDPAADFCITATASVLLWVDQVSLIAEPSATPFGLGRDVVDALRKRRPAVLRWPAGPGVLHYNWRAGVGPADQRPVASVVGGARATFEAAPNSVGTNEVLALCKDIKAEPMLVVNPTLGMRPALYWLEYCNGEANTRLGKLRAEQGRIVPWGVKLWAIGGLPLGRVEPERYAEDAGKIVEAMREQDPSVCVLPLLWGGHPTKERVAVEAAGPALRVVAARSGGKVIARLVHVGDRAVDAAVTVKGLGQRRLAAEAEHLSIGADAQLTQAKLAVAGATVRLSVQPRTVHVLILRLEAKPK